MKKLSFILSAILILSILSGCTAKPNSTDVYDGVQIILSDSGITADGAKIQTNENDAVYIGNDIIYYEEGKDFTYGDGEASDAHSKEEADAHTVLHITKAGRYVISGSLSKGQIAIDLGEDAKEDAEKTVTLVLNNVDITCTVAPAIIFYNVYECSSTDTETAQKDVDTSKAGANVIIADGSENTVNGSYVAKIYKPESVVLGDDKTAVETAKKLHKYDGAFYSKMSMNVGGGSKGDGILNINAENEGLDSELHLTLNGGIININAGNDGINTNEDYVSVTTVNGGALTIIANGKTGEGDGIDSNGWLVINGGSVFAEACAVSGDAGIDSDKGIHINGGTVFATGNMLDRISESNQNFAVFTFNSASESASLSLKNSKEKTVIERNVTNRFTYLIISCPELAAGEYTLWEGDTQLYTAASQGGMMGAGGFNGGGAFPEGMQNPEGMEMPEGMERPEDMQMPEGMERPEDMQMPEGMERPNGMGRPNGTEQFTNGEYSDAFSIKDGENYFSVKKTV